MTTYEISVYRREKETGVSAAQLFTTARKSIASEEDLAEILAGLEIAFPEPDYNIVVFLHESKTTQIKREDL